MGKIDDMSDIDPDDKFIDGMRKYNSGDIPDPSEEDKKKSKEKIDKLVNDAEILYRENSKKLDQKMIWLSGGALFIISNSLASFDSISIYEKIFLITSVICFASCIGSVIFSYIFAKSQLYRIPLAKEIRERLIVLSARVKPGNHDMNRKLATKIVRLHDLKLNPVLRWSEKFGLLTNISNYLAWLSFIIGLVGLAFFAVSIIQNFPIK